MTGGSKLAQEGAFYPEYPETERSPPEKDRREAGESW